MNTFKLILAFPLIILATIYYYFNDPDTEQPPTRPPKKKTDLNLFDTVDPFDATEAQGCYDCEGGK